MILDQAEQFVKNAEKCDGLGELEVIQEKPPGLQNFTITEPILIDSVKGQKDFPLFSNPKVCEDLESKSTSQDAYHLEQAEITECPTENEIPKEEEEEENMDKQNDKHSNNLNELLLDLSEALDVTGGELVKLAIPSKTESSTLLDQSFTEDVVTQPLLSDIIQNGAFNPSHPDTLTDDELESYLAELEKEEEGDLSQPVISQENDMGDNVHLHPSNDVSSSSPKIVQIDEENSVPISDIINEDESSIFPIIEEGNAIAASDSEVTSTEESSFSDSDTGEVNSQLHEDSSASAEEEMPQLIDDPSLMNSENVAELIPAEVISEQNEATIETENACLEHNQEDVPATSEIVNESVAIVEGQQELVSSTQEEVSDATSATIGVSLGTGEDSLLEPYSSLTEDERLLGVLQPVWIPDEMAPQCMNCSQRFTGMYTFCMHFRFDF